MKSPGYVKGISTVQHVCMQVTCLQGHLRTRDFLPLYSPVWPSRGVMIMHARGISSVSSMYKRFPPRTPARLHVRMQYS
jgi:hypothetical protein